jgi:DNA-binding FadR family transcriptional regulator
MKTIEPIEMTSIHKEIQHRLKEYIIANNLQAGAPLPSETQLAEQLGVSRAVVREALRSLESLGVIHSRRGAGRYVSQFNLDPVLQNLSYGMLFDVEDLQEIIAVRERLEVGFLAEAIDAMDEATLNQMREVLDRMEQKAMTGQEYLAEDLAFHRCIFSMTGNRLLIKLLDIFRFVYQNLHNQSLAAARNSGTELQNHRAILQAVEAKNVVLARQLLSDHFDGIKERLKTAGLINKVTP